MLAFEKSQFWIIWDGQRSAVIGASLSLSLAEDQGLLIVALAHRSDGASALDGGGDATGKVTSTEVVGLASAVAAPDDSGTSDVRLPVRLPENTLFLEVLAFDDNHSLEPVCVYRLQESLPANADGTSESLIFVPSDVVANGLDGAVVRYQSSNELPIEELNTGDFCWMSSFATAPYVSRAHHKLRDMGPATLRLPGPGDPIEVQPLRYRVHSYGTTSQRSIEVLAARARVRSVGFVIEGNEAAPLSGLYAFHIHRQAQVREDWQSAFGFSEDKWDELSRIVMHALNERAKDELAAAGLNWKDYRQEMDDDIASYYRAITETVQQICLNPANERSFDPHAVELAQNKRNARQFQVYFPHAALHDWIVFCDVRKRGIRYGRDKFSQQGLAFFRVEPDGLAPKDPVSLGIESHIKRLYMSREARETGADSGAQLVLPEEWQAWLRSIGAQSDARRFVPLLADSSRVNGLAPFATAADWNDFTTDPAAHVGLRTVFPAQGAARSRRARSSPNDPLIRRVLLLGGKAIRIDGAMDWHKELRLLVRLWREKRNPHAAFALERVSDVALDGGKHDLSKIATKLARLETLCARDGVLENLTGDAAEVAQILTGVIPGMVSVDRLTSTLEEAEEKKALVDATLSAFQREISGASFAVAPAKGMRSSNRAERMLSTLEEQSGAAEAEFAGLCREFLTKFNFNEWSQTYVVDMINEKFPDLEEPLDRRLEQMLTRMISDTAPDATLGALAPIAKSVRPEDWSEGARRAREELVAEVGAMALVMPRDQDVAEDLTYVAALQQMEQQFQFCTDTAARMAAAGDPRAAHVNRRLKVWPADADATVLACQSFVNDLTRQAAEPVPG